MVQSPIRSLPYIGQSGTCAVRSRVAGAGGSTAVSTYRPSERVRTSVRTGSLPSFSAAIVVVAMRGLLVGLGAAVTKRAYPKLFRRKAAKQFQGFSRAQAPRRPR